MMKKNLLFGMFAAAGMLLATSCSNDELDAGLSGDKAAVSFTLGVENGVGTRAISDGTGAKQLTYRVFDENGDPVGLEKVTENVPSYPHKVTLTLAKGQTYKVAFWAQNKDCTAYTVGDDMNVSIDYAGNNNDETRDAFFKTETVTVAGDMSLNVVLKRPFAQINVGTYQTDWDAAVASGIEIGTSKVSINNAATGINLLDGTVSGEQVVEYAFDAIPAEPLKVDLDKDGTKEDYKYLSMSYILVNPNAEGDETVVDGASKAVLADLSFSFKPKAGNEIALGKAQGLGNVPVQRNYRTNIIGKLLTGDVNFNISIDPIYDGEYNRTLVWEGKTENAPVAVDGKVNISSAQQLADLAIAVNAGNSYEGVTVVLENDIDLECKLWTPIGTSTNKFKGSLDGNDKTISNLNVSADKGAIGLIGYAGGGTKDEPISVTNLTIDNAEVNSGRAAVGAVVGKADGAHIAFSNITVKGIVKLHAPFGQVGAVLGNNPNGAVYASDIVVDVEDGSYVSTEGNTNYYDYVGGVFGQIWGSNFKNITSNIDVISGTGAGVGGISGGATGTWENITCSGNVTVLMKDEGVWYKNNKEDGNSYGEVKWYQGAGTVIGYHGGVTYTKCTSTGTLTYPDGTHSNDLYFFNSAGQKVEDSRFGCSRWSNDNTVIIND